MEKISIRSTVFTPIWFHGKKVHSQEYNLYKKEDDTYKGTVIFNAYKRYRYLYKEGRWVDSSFVVIEKQEKDDDGGYVCKYIIINTDELSFRFFEGIKDKTKDIFYKIIWFSCFRDENKNRYVDSNYMSFLQNLGNILFQDEMFFLPEVEDIFTSQGEMK